MDGGWHYGDRLEDCALSWDAWKRARPNVERSVWNEPGEGMPAVGERPLLPRRIQVEFEFERQKDLKRRTRLTRYLATNDTALFVDNSERVPHEKGTFVLLGSEWMEVVSLSGNSVTVRRGARGTRPGQHERGTLIHYGQRSVRELPVPLHEDNWNL